MHLAQLQKNHTHCSPSSHPHSRKSISWLVTRGPETTEQHQEINHLSALTRCFHSFPIQASLPSVKRGKTHLLGHFPQPAWGASKTPCFHPCLSLLQNDPQPGLQLFSIANRIPFMVLRKVRGLRLILQRVEPPAGPFPLNSK